MENTSHIPYEQEREQEHAAGDPQHRAQSRGAQTLLFDPISRVSLWERTKYTASTALTVGGLAELLGFGGLSVLLGAAGGVVGYLFSDELHDFVLNHLPAPKAARRSRKSRAYWWLTGETLPDGESEDYPPRSSRLSSVWQTPRRRCRRQISIWQVCIYRCRTLPCRSPPCSMQRATLHERGLHL